MWFNVLLVVVAAWLVIRRWKNRHLIKTFDQFKSDAIELPFLGHLYRLIGFDGDKFLTSIQTVGREACKYDGMSKFKLGPYFLVVVADAEIAGFVAKTCLDKGHFVKPLRNVTGNGVFFAPVSVWRHHRKVLNSMFTQKNMNYFMKIFSKKSDIMVEQLRKTVGAGPFSVFDHFVAYSMDSICETSLGVERHSQLDFDDTFTKKLEEAMALVSERMFNPLIHNDTVYSIFPSCRKFRELKEYGYNYIENLIKLKRQEVTENLMKKQDLDTRKDNDKTDAKLMKLLIETPEFSDRDLLDEVMTLIVAATDSTATVMSFAMLMLARHPDEQEKVYTELKDVFGDSSSPVVTEDLPRLEYLDAFLKETMRLYSPGPAVVREVLEDVTLPTGIKLAKGCIVVLNVWAIHRYQRYWGADAELFRPDRFLNTPLKHPAQFMAFSNGPRNCLGYQYAMRSMKTAMATLLRHYRVLPAVDAKPLLLKFNVMVKDADNFMVELEPRI